MPSTPATNAKFKDVLAGLTVAFALIPEALAFAVVAGLSPLTGLYAAFTVGFITSVFGTRAGMISGATGAVAVVLTPVAAELGPEAVFATVIGAGFLQVLAGLGGLGRRLHIRSKPVISGFLNGLAIILFISQAGQFRYTAGDHTSHWLQGSQLFSTILLVTLAIVVVVLLPRLSKAVPSSLAAILLLFLLAPLLPWPVRHIGDIASVKGTFPPFHLPAIAFTPATVLYILPHSAIMACVGIIESLLTMSMLDRIRNEQSSPKKEMLVQGFANIVSGSFSGMGGCAMTGQTRLNMEAGGKTRLAGLTASLLLLVFILFASALVNQIPTAALAGIMIMIAVNTFQWESLSSLRTAPLKDSVIMLTVTGIGVATGNLALAVITGLLLSALINKFTNQQCST